MKHKLSVLSVLLALLALVLVFTACGDDTNISSEGSIKPRTITIYSIKGDGTTDEAVDRVEEKLNKITESLYKIRVELRFFEADQYEEELRKAITANENGEVIINTSTSNEEKEAVETVVNEYGVPQDEYPEAVENQFDIFLIPEGVSSFDYYTQTYLDYTDDDGAVVKVGGVATDLNSHLTENGAAYVLNQYIPAKVLDFCRKDSIDSTSALYGIPSNNYYGEAEYMLINKKLFDEMCYDPSTITDMYSVQQFLVDLAAECKKGNYEGVIPLYNTPSMNLVSVTGYKSVVAQVVANNALVSAGMYTPMNIFAIPGVQKGMGFVNAINVAGEGKTILPRVTDTVDFSKEFGAAFLYGSADVVNKYADDYHIIMTSVPLIDGEDIYKGIYAVSNYAAEYADRCVQVLTCMTINAEFRNLLGYGIENINYIIDEETGLVMYTDASNIEVEVEDKDTGAVTVTNMDLTYKMDLEQTGNMFLLMQNSQMTEEELILSNNNWAIAKETNNSAIVSPYAKFVFSTRYIASDYGSSTYAAMALTVPELEKLYDEIWTWIAEYPTYVSPTTGEKLNTFTEYLRVLQDELEKNLYVSSASSLQYATSIRSQYANWYGVTYGGNQQ